MFDIGLSTKDKSWKVEKISQQKTGKNEHVFAPIKLLWLQNTLA